MTDLQVCLCSFGVFVQLKGRSFAIGCLTSLSDADMFVIITIFLVFQMKWKEVVQDCSQAVEMNPRYVKALFRRAKALEKLDNKRECLEGETLRFIEEGSGVYWSQCTGSSSSDSFTQPVVFSPSVG